MEDKLISNLNLLESAYSILSNVEPMMSDEEYECLLGVRDQVARIIRDSVEAEDTL